MTGELPTYRWDATPAALAALRRSIFTMSFSWRRTGLVYLGLLVGIVVGAEGDWVFAAVAYLLGAVVLTLWLWWRAGSVTRRLFEAGGHREVVYGPSSLRILFEDNDSEITYARLRHPRVTRWLVSWGRRGDFCLDLPREVVPDQALAWIAAGRGPGEDAGPTRRPDELPADLACSGPVTGTWQRVVFGGIVCHFHTVGRWLVWTYGLAVLLALLLAVTSPWLALVALVWPAGRLLELALVTRRAWPRGERREVRLTEAGLEVVEAAHTQRLEYGHLEAPRLRGKAVLLRHRGHRVVHVLPLALVTDPMLARLTERCSRPI